MENVSAEQPARSVLVTQGIRAAGVGILANSMLCLLWPRLTEPRNWFPNIVFAVFTVHLMGWIFRDFLRRPRIVSANTLGFAIALIMPLCYLSRAA
jgi:hypothetical protein